MVLTQTAAFVVTLTVEGALALLVARRFGSDRRLAAAAAVLGSALTHPFVWFGAMALAPAMGGWGIPLLEAGAIVVEACVYRALAAQRWRTAFILSALANGLSWGLGVLIQAL